MSKHGHHGLDLEALPQSMPFTHAVQPAHDSSIARW